MSHRDSAEICIRPMVESDATVVAQLATELGYPADAETIRMRMRATPSPDLLVVAVSSDDVPLGFVHAHELRMIEADLRVEILGLVVSSNARRGGIGGKLITAVEDWAQAIGAVAIVVRSNTARDEAHRFYPSHGYEKIKTQAVYQKRCLAK